MITKETYDKVRLALYGALGYIENSMGLAEHGVIPTDLIELKESIKGRPQAETLRNIIDAILLLEGVNPNEMR